MSSAIAITCVTCLSPLLLDSTLQGLVGFEERHTHTRVVVVVVFFFFYPLRVPSPFVFKKNGKRIKDRRREGGIMLFPFVLSSSSSKSIGMSVCVCLTCRLLNVNVLQLAIYIARSVAAAGRAGSCSLLP